MTTDVLKRRRSRTYYTVAGVDRARRVIMIASSVRFQQEIFSASGGLVNFVVERLGDSSADIGVSYQTSDLTAQAGLDYTAASGTLTWLGGDVSTRTIPITLTTPVDISWQSRNPTAQRGWVGVAYGNSTFVAVAQSGTGHKTMRSTDGGDTWTTFPSSNDTTGSWEGVAFGNGRFVAIDDGGSSTTARAMYSTDNGQTWTAGTTPSGSVNWCDVAYGNGKFIAVAVSAANTTQLNGKRIISSSDGGANWTAVGPGDTTTPNQWTGVTFAGGRFVVVGGFGSFGGAGAGMKAAYSDDGTNWTIVSTPEPGDGPANWISVAGDGNGRFIAVDSAAAPTYCMVSNDNGVTWTLNNMPSTSSLAGWTSITYAQGRFHAVANQGNATATSFDGITWNTHTAPVSGWESIAYGGNRWVAVRNEITTNQVMVSDKITPEGDFTLTLSNPTGGTSIGNPNPATGRII